MSHSHHGHSHGTTVNTGNRRRVFLSFILIFAFMIVEVVGGILSGSLALLADAGHMLTDAAALALAYAGFRFGARAPDARRTFGYARFEVVAGFVNAITLFVVAGWIVFEAARRFQHPQEVLSGPMLIVASAGLIVNLAVFRILTRGDSSHVNIRGAALHVLGDLLGSVGAILAGLVIALTGWTPIDPILSVVVSLLILRSAWKLLGQSLHILLEGTPAGISPDEVGDCLVEKVPGLAAVRHVHIWSLTSGRVLATMHVQPEGEADARMVVHAAEQILRTRFGIEHATIAIDWPGASPICSLGPATAEGERPIR